MNPLLEQAGFLRERRRFDEAIAAIRQYLAAHPDDFDGHYELAVTRLLDGKELKQALADIQRAIGLEPEAAHAHAIRSSILSELDRHQDALTAADDALRIEPEMAFAWVCRGRALLNLKLLDGAGEAARKALALDPDDVTASNLLATALRLQKRYGEAEHEIGRNLARDPEDAWTFANAGWTALQQGQAAKAEELFREALRLSPETEHAREGLREAYKARSGLYRLYLRWVFFMQRHSGKNRWLIIIGIYLAFRFGRVLLAAVHPLAAVPLVIAYLVFVFGSWLAGSLGNLLLLKDRNARLSLTRKEKLDGLVVGGSAVLGSLLMVAGVTVLPTAFAFLGGAMLASALPGGMVFDNPSTKGRLVFGFAFGVVWICGLTVFIRLLGSPPGGELEGADIGQLVTIGALAAMLSTWLGSIRSLRVESQS